jgi:hypothetical protein
MGTVLILCLVGQVQADLPHELRKTNLIIAELPMGKSVRAHKEAMIIDSDSKAWLNGNYVVTYNDPAGRFMELQITHGKAGYYVRISPLQETRVSLTGPNLLYFSYPTWTRTEEPEKHHIPVSFITTDPLPKADPDPPRRREKGFIEVKIKKPSLFGPQKFISPGERIDMK